MASNNHKNNEAKNNVWIFSAAILLACLIVGWFIENKIGSDVFAADYIQKSAAGLLSLGAIITFIVNLIVSFKTHRFRRAFTIVSCLISIMIFCFAYFAYIFN